MDPWVTTQIRLAERQGLLTGRDLGPVQVKAVLLCQMLDTVRAYQREDADLKAALLATGRFEFTDLFPEYASNPQKESTEAEIEEALSSDGAVSYVFPGPGDPNFDPEEAQRMFDELIAGNSSGTVNGADLDDL
jgi:hypothetical protein